MRDAKSHADPSQLTPMSEVSGPDIQGAVHAKLLDVLRESVAQGRTARIALVSGEAQVGRIVMVNGFVAWAMCQKQRHLLGSFLLRVGGITREQLDTATAIYRAYRGKRELGAVLDELGFMSRPALRHCLLLHIRSAMRSLLALANVRISSEPVTMQVDEALLFHLDTVLTAAQRPPAPPAPPPASKEETMPMIFPQPSAPPTEPHATRGRFPKAVPPPEPPKAVPMASEEAESREPPKLRDLLHDLLRTEGVSMAVLVGRDGLVIDGASARSGIDIDVIGAVISTGIGSAEVMGNELKTGSMTQGMLEYENGAIIMGPAGDAILVAVADAQANLGMVRYQLKKRSPEIAKLLG